MTDGCSLVNELSVLGEPLGSMKSVPDGKALGTELYSTVGFKLGSELGRAFCSVVPVSDGLVLGGELDVSLSLLSDGIAEGRPEGNILAPELGAGDCKGLDFALGTELASADGLLL